MGDFGICFPFALFFLFVCVFVKGLFFFQMVLFLLHLLFVLHGIEDGMCGVSDDVVSGGHCLVLEVST